MNSSFKEQVIQVCKQLLEARITTAKTAMQNAQEAANSEDKSSAGDKYETSRAMGQLDRDMNAKQLQEAMNELKLLNQFALQTGNEKVTNGSLVRTAQSCYYIGVGLGQIKVGEQAVIALSPKAPLAQLLMNKKNGETFSFNQRQHQLLEIL